MPVLIKTKNKLTDDASAGKIQEAINHLERFAGFVGEWQLSGPYVIEKGDLFETAFAPEKPGKANAKWKTVSVGSNGAVNLSHLIGGFNRAAYLRVNVLSDRARDVRFEMGSDDGMKVWVNGKVVHSINAARALAPNQDKVNVRLDEGENVILMKITQLTGGWEACLRIRDTDGSKAEGLTFKF